MRYIALICAAVVIVAGAVVGTALVISSDDPPSAQRAAGNSTSPAPTPTPSVTSTPDRFALADAGLRRLVAAHVPTAARPVITLTSCPFAPRAALASTGLEAAGLDSADSRRGTVDVKDWNDYGDHGIAVTCRFTGPRRFTVAAFSHTHAVTQAPIPHYDGPFTFGGGRLYRSTDRDLCAAYWTPPTSTFVISTQFAASEPVTANTCGAALRAVQPTILTGLVRLQRA